MIKTMCFLLIASVAFIYSSCSGSDSTDSPALKKGNYSYTISDSSGKSLVEGMLKIDSVKKEPKSTDYVVMGSYTITKMTNDTTYMSLSALREGDLRGYYNESLKFININTNPQIADANVFINATVNGNNIKGGWSFSTFRSGHAEGGLFNANKTK